MVAILKSGGFARFAKRKKVFAVRSLDGGKTEKIPVNIKRVQSRKAPGCHPSGDGHGCGSREMV
ncbi:MAG: hypothetical protein M2R45_04541 [Verrucomicrobia subdivision 3 bacterium]|nr:hypothetical protein [Limisphaerales bacterium]MCS1416820.1 hypothetical protein [Limisphaerales bacterium]